MRVARINKEDGRVLEVLELAADDERLISEDEIPLNPADVVEAGVHRWDGDQFVELPFKALLLDAGDVLEAVVDLASSAEISGRHVDLRPYGGDCDREPGAYRWDRVAEQLVPLKAAARRSAPGGVSLETAFNELLELNPQLKTGGQVMVWQAGYRASLDASKGGKQK